jgi:orotate phosphoribosyltransferase
VIHISPRNGTYYVPLFQTGNFTLASGARSTWKIECDALTTEDWDGLAAMLVQFLPKMFGEVIGVPRGGAPFAAALESYVNPDVQRVLIVDDVWTTGGSMTRFIEAHEELRILRDGGRLDRAVVFARNPTPPDVTALFTMPERGT